GPEMIVKTPGANTLPDRNHFRDGARVRELLHHALEARDISRNFIPVAIVLYGKNRRAAPIDQALGRAKHRARPDALAFDRGVESKGRGVRRRIAKINGIAEVFRAEAQAQLIGVFSDHRFNGMFSGSDVAGDFFRPRPEGGLKATFAC